MEKKAYAILRIGKLSLGQLAGAVAHNQREVHPKNADIARLHSNVDYLAHDDRSVRARWEGRMAACGNPAVRKNAVAAIELFMGYSPEATWIDPLQWGRDCAEFAAQTFGEDNAISQVLHMDERTPHSSTLSVPLVFKSFRGGEPEWRLTASHWIDGRARCEELQTLFWEKVGKKHGLARGEKGSSRKHVPQSEMYATSNAVETIIADTIESIPPANPDESESERNARLKKHLEQNLRVLSEAAKQVAILQSTQRAARAAELKRRREAERRRRADEGRKRAEENAERLRKEAQDRLRDLPVSVVLRRVLGIVPRREGEQLVFDTPTIKISVHSDERRFMVFRGDKPGGSGAISAITQAIGCSFQQAVRWLAADFGAAEIESSLRLAYENVIRRTAKDAITNPVTVAERLAHYAPVVQAKWPIVREYLVHTRCLPGSWIDAMHRHGHIWANDHGSACFGHRNLSGQIVGASIRGTHGDVKYHQSVGSKGEGFFRLALSKSSPTQIAVVESPIEALSLASLNRNEDTLYASTAGAGGLKLILDTAQGSGWKVLAAQNDDAAGDVQALHTADICGAHNLACVRVRPPFADWNDTLKFLHREFERTQPYEALLSKRLREAWVQNAHADQLALHTSKATSLFPEPTANQDTNLSI